MKEFRDIIIRFMPWVIIGAGMGVVAFNGLIGLICLSIGSITAILSVKYFQNKENES
jgi:hypothetical protein